MKRMIIVLDGPAGAGKSTVAREVARSLDLPFLDTGAIYRAITWVLLGRAIPAQDSPELREELASFSIRFDGSRVFVRGREVTDEIRTPEIDREVSPYSALAFVRGALLQIQREQAVKGKGLVAEGRDMGTVVFPGADLKIFLTASPEARALRRYKERRGRGEDVDYAEILTQVNRRDGIDASRETAPLMQAEDAVLLDSTDLSREQVVERVLELASSRRKVPAAAQAY